MSKQREIFSEMPCPPEEMNYKELKEYGFINETKVRNYYIRKDFYELMDSGKTMNQAFGKLSDKYFVSPSTIACIAYRG